MNGKRKPGIVRRGICWVFCAVMLVQIGYSFAWMAQNFDTVPDFGDTKDNVMYTLAPMLEEKVGKEKAREYYRTMAGAVWRNMPGKVLGDIGEDLWTVVTIPLEHYRAIRGIPGRQTNIRWNILHCMSVKTPELTLGYDRTCFWILIAGLCLGIPAWLSDRLVYRRGKTLYPVVPYIISTVILILWFTLGDGAPPNDRYFLTLYMVYAWIPWLVISRKDPLPGINSRPAALP